MFRLIRQISSGAILGVLGGVCWVCTHIAMRPLFLSKTEDCLGSKLIEEGRSAQLALSITLSTANVISLSNVAYSGSVNNDEVCDSLSSLERTLRH